MEEEKESVSTSSEKKGAKKKLERQRSRLQMQAPSSIQVTHTSISSLSDWNIPIPLLSPLDFPNPLHHHPSNIPPPSSSSSSSFIDIDHQELRQREEKDDGDIKGNKSGTGWRGWQHPAEPFHYEPVPGKAPAFLLPSHCT
ncbi:uncharacterized protein At4g14450, chloroplastic-like [Dioscorea cayenensis subsp. rotundata]|uniref:Uncharacterized protein At4g14450, chloroplastic-like n=1 Tax=Dioscorea cayennensis subsp. rotundata TaxID=55577 RepID=A0AB40AZL0_DIOCR|nr:uncharacterized protein At4g14450, chloroplastic-like [Dioscorea cayenensis subsp. rotundata]